MKLQLSGLGVKWIVVLENKRGILYLRVEKRLQKNTKIPKQVLQTVFFSAPFPQFNGLFPVRIPQNRTKIPYSLKLKNECCVKVLGSSNLASARLLIFPGDPEQAALSLWTSVAFCSRSEWEARIGKYLRFLPATFFKQMLSFHKL